MGRSKVLVVILVSLSCFLRSFADSQPEWRAGFKDDFERQKLGDVYEPGVGTKASISNGHMILQGQPAYLMINSPVARDIRVEFEAMALTDQPIGSIGCLLHSSSSDHYKIEFGAENNTVNRLVGPGLNIVDTRPRVLIQPGQWHHVSVQREGKRITCAVDGTLILDGTVEKIVGASGIQRVALISEHGMAVDNIAMFTRVPAHPDSYPLPYDPLPVYWKEGKYQIAEGINAPNLAEAVRALNECRWKDAQFMFNAMEDVTIKLAGLACMYGDINYYERPVYGECRQDEEKEDYSEEQIDERFGEQGRFALLWKSEMEKHPDNQVLKYYWPTVKAFGRLALNRWHASKHAREVMSLDERINPFYYKAKLYDARARYWNAMEAGDANAKGKALADMKWLLRIRPDNRIVNEYAGTPVPWGEYLNADTDEHPAWAAYLREAYARELAILERFCEMRQMPDGQFGGGWGDDVEMMRKWVPIAAISTCSSSVRRGIEHLAEGVWTYACHNGFEKGEKQVGDVEHSAEPSADTFPTMLLLKYGDPLWFERNLRSCKTIKEMFMGVDQKGHPRFKSSFFDATGVAIHDRSGGDTGYCARAMKHFLWAAWYGNAEAKDWYLRWVNGWREMAMLDAPDKPAGVLPGDIWFPSGSYKPLSGSKNPWYVDDPAHVYGPFGTAEMIYDSFLAAYSLSADRKFLQPIELLMDWASFGPYQKDSERAKYPRGSREWFRQPMQHMHKPQHTALYRYFTGVRAYDEYTMRFGTPPQKYQINHDLDVFMNDIEVAAKSLRNNLWYYTTEVLSTDRLHLPAVETVFGAYTGAITTTGDTETQTFAVTYDTPSTDFAALVVDSTPERLRVWLYSFWDKPTEIGLHLWRLRPGEYILSQGEQLRGEFPFQHRYAWKTQRRVRILRRADQVRVILPPGKVYVVDLRLARELGVPEKACDLAIAPSDVTVDRGSVSVTVHNIGQKPAENFTVSLQRQTRVGKWSTLASTTVKFLAEPKNLEPSTALVTFKLPEALLAGKCRVLVDAKAELFEICESNNIAEVPSHLTIGLGGGVKMEFILVPAGDYMMGARKDDPHAACWEYPQHKVVIPEPFYIGKYEVTQAQWVRVMGRNPSTWRGSPAMPVNNINWFDAKEFCRRTSEITGFQIRLPKEAEWEYACRAGSTASYCFGNDDAMLADYGWYGANSGLHAHPVGLKKPNAWGIHDMHGNLKEWCEEICEPYPGSPCPPDTWDDKQRVMRGGYSNYIEPWNQGSSRRDRSLPEMRAYPYGLRVVIPLQKTTARYP